MGFQGSDSVNDNNRFRPNIWQGNYHYEGMEDNLEKYAQTSVLLTGFELTLTDSLR